MSAGQLCIGPVRFDVAAEPGVTLKYSDKAYQGFWREAGQPAISPVEASMNVSVRMGANPLPVHEPIYEGGKNWAMWRDGQDIIVCSGFHGQPVPRFHARIDRDLRHAVLILDPARVGSGTLIDAPSRYPLDQILTWGLLSRIGGIIMHAAVAVKNDQGYIFTGRSGAGKSTISSLCKDAGWQILNDDRVIVYPGAKGLRVCGTPWHGSGRYAEAADVSLGGIFFIHKSANDWSETVRSDEAKLALLDVAAVPWFHDDWSAGALNSVDAISQKALFYRLHFTRTMAAVTQVEWVIGHQMGVPV